MIKAITIIFFLAGIGLVVYSLKLPYYTNQAAKEKLEQDVNQQNMADGGRSYAKIKEKYYTSVDKLKTNKNTYFDLGSGISVASFCIFLFLLVYKIKKVQDFLRIKSFNKTLVFLTAIPTWLLMIPGSIWYYTFRGERGDYPMFADSIAIPLMYGSIAICLGLFGLFIFLIITTRKSTFPTLIFIKPITYNKTGILRETFWGLLLSFNLFCFYSFVIDGDHVSIFVNLFFTYLILVLRAGQVNSFNIRNTPKIAPPLLVLSPTS